MTGKRGKEVPQAVRNQGRWRDRWEFLEDDLLQRKAGEVKEE